MADNLFDRRIFDDSIKGVRRFAGDFRRSIASNFKRSQEIISDVRRGFLSCLSSSKVQCVVAVAMSFLLVEHRWLRWLSIDDTRQARDEIILIVILAAVIFVAIQIAVMLFPVWQFLTSTVSGNPAKVFAICGILILAALSFVVAYLFTFPPDYQLRSLLGFSGCCLMYSCTRFILLSLQAIAHSNSLESEQQYMDKKNAVNPLMYTLAVVFSIFGLKQPGDDSSHPLEFDDELHGPHNPAAPGKKHPKRKSR